jgi:hypothetical protein
MFILQGKRNIKNFQQGHFVTCMILFLAVHFLAEHQEEGSYGNLAV